MGEKEIRPLLQFYIELPEQYSNGEAAMSYCENIFEPDTMYLLDEPDNSLSPALQLILNRNSAP